MLFLASMMAFAVSRFSWRFNISLLMLFTAGNLLPPQVIITPLYRMYLALPLPPPLSDNGLLYDQYFGIIAHPRRLPARLLHVRAEQLHEDAAEGAERGRAGRRRVGLADLRQRHPAALPAGPGRPGDLEVTWIYNDFFWALSCMRTGDQAADHVGPEQPQGPVLHRQQPARGGRDLVALPTLIVYFVLQRQFVRGLTLGSTKG